MNKHILQSLDLLNSYVRSEACRKNWDSWTLRKAVYVYKNEFLRVYAAQWNSKCFVIRSKVQCRDCGGTGRYIDSYGYKHDHCWACNSKGMATLHFVETHWPQGPVWHTPLLKWPWIRNTEGYSTTNDMLHKCDWASRYEPNQEGKEAPLLDVIIALSGVEEWYWNSGQAEPVRSGWESGWDGERYPRRGFLRYKLNIGSRGYCPLCGQEETEKSRRCRAGGHPYLDWAEPVCRECYEQNKDNIWDVLREQIVPAGKCTATVMFFLRTHGSIVEKHGGLPECVR